jgi:hypothetical protein
MVLSLNSKQGGIVKGLSGFSTIYTNIEKAARRMRGGF